MTNTTKAAQAALRDLADWHWSQATTLRKAAITTAIDKPEPSRSSLLRMADWHEEQKQLLASLQDKAVVARDAGWYRLIRDGSGWPAVFAAHDAPEPLRGDDLDAAMLAASQQKGGQ